MERPLENKRKTLAFLTLKIQVIHNLPETSCTNFYILFGFLERSLLFRIYICKVKYSKHLLIFFTILFDSQTAFIVET
jgi:hypothetical protein